MRLAVQNLHVAYRKKEILTELSMELQEGQLVALVGLNGSGKSTLLRAISGMIGPRKGRISLRTDEKEYDLSQMQPHQISRLGIIYMLQRDNVFATLSVEENLEMARQLACRRAQPHATVSDACSRFPKLSTMLHRSAGCLSGGERQALALSMTMLCRPLVMLLDEPTAGMTPGLVPEVLAYIRDVCHQTGAAALLVEQNIRQALKFADRALLLSEGAVRPIPTDVEPSFIVAQAVAGSSDTAEMDRNSRSEKEEDER